MEFYLQVWLNLTYWNILFQFLNIAYVFTATYEEETNLYNISIT
jgi:hypothetical protein